MMFKLAMLINVSYCGCVTHFLQVATFVFESEQLLL